ncbi:MAG: hypothetical protein JWM28_3855, partial [Chitinophagaceae bacterium]|nr:hypothetical protein [Chitinophagaceae bacterium]
NGVINTGSNILTLSAGSSISGVSNSSHVNGIVRKIGNTSFTFPVGDDTYYAPVSISAPSGITDHFTASYTRANPITAYNNTNYGNGIIGISSNEYWILNRTYGNSNVAVTLGWNAARSTSLTDLPIITVSRWDGSAWTNAGNAGGLTGTLSAGTVTSGTVTNFSPFTIGLSSGILTVDLINFTAIRHNKKVNLAWQTASEINSNRFETERSPNGNTWIKIGEVKAQGSSNRVADYSFVDGNPESGNNYYRLKQFDNDGKFVYSQVRKLNFSVIQNAVVYPNPFTTNITIDGGDRIIGDVSIVDMNGKIVYRSRITKAKETVNLSQLAAGQYTIIHNTEFFKIIKMQH